MHAFNSTASSFIIFGKCNGDPLYLIFHVCMWSTTVCRSNKMRALLAQRCCQPLRWNTDLCTATNLEYSFCITVWRANTSFSIVLLNSALSNVVTCSHPCTAACNSLAMHSFSAINNRTLELVASTYALVALANEVGCFHTLDTITYSSNRPRHTWTFRVGTLCDCTTLCCDSSKDMLCISTSRLYSRIFVSP